MIDPKFINSVALFKGVVNKYPLAERLEIGSPIQYYFDHSPEDRIKQLQRLTGYSADVVEFLLKTGVATSFDKYENMRNEIPDEVCCNPFMFTHVLSEDFSVKNIKYFPKLLDYIPTINELIEGKYSKIQLPTLGSSVKRMFLVYTLFNSLKMDTDCFKYYKHSPDLEESLNSLGHSSKAILKVIIKQSREKYGTEGFLGEILDIKYLNNCLNPNKAIRMILGQIRNVKKMDISLDTIWSVLADGCSIEGVYGYGGLSCLFKFYLYRYRRWSNHSDVVIMDDGSEFYSHRHSMLNSYSRHIGKDGSDCPANVRLPTSINTSPNELFRDFIESYAKSEYLNLITEYGTIEFKDMNDKFQHLDSSKYKYLDNPVALIIEGKHMRHCVGGDRYQNYLKSGTMIFFHLDIPDMPRGATLSLRRNDITSFGDYYRLKGCDTLEWWSLDQFYGYRDEPMRGHKVAIELRDKLLGTHFEKMTPEYYESISGDQETMWLIKQNAHRNESRWGELFGFNMDMGGFPHLHRPLQDDPPDRRACGTLVSALAETYNPLEDPMTAVTRSLEMMALGMTPETSRRALESVIQQTHPQIGVEFGADGRIQYTLNRDNPPLEELVTPKPTSEEVPQVRGAGINLADLQMRFNR